MTGYQQAGSGESLTKTMFSLLGSASTQGQAFLQRFLFSAFDHLLRQQQWARERLAAHAGQGICFAVDPDGLAERIATQWRVTIDPQGFLRAAEPDAPIHVSLFLRASPDALFGMLREGPQAVMQHVRIEGDASLATTVGDLARYLRWEPEEDLSRFVGDAAAHRITGFARSVSSQLLQTGERLLDSTSSYLLGDQQQLTTRPLMAWLKDAGDELEAQVGALELRLARLRKTARS